MYSQLREFGLQLLQLFQEVLFGLSSQLVGLQFALRVPRQMETKNKVIMQATFGQ